MSHGFNTWFLYSEQTLELFREMFWSNFPYAVNQSTPPVAPVVVEGEPVGDVDPNDKKDNTEEKDNMEEKDVMEVDQSEEEKEDRATGCGPEKEETSCFDQRDNK